MAIAFSRSFLIGSCLLLCSCALHAQESSPRVEIAPQFTYLGLQAPGNEEAGGFGGRATWNLHRSLGLEAELNFFPGKISRATASSLQGGRGLQGLFGAKGGIQWERIGIFGKARAGFVSFSKVIKTVDIVPAPSITFGRLTEPALDVGAVAEVYLSKRVALRYDLGDTIVFYRARSLGNATPRFPGLTVHSFQFSSGVVFRF